MQDQAEDGVPTHSDGGKSSTCSGTCKRRASTSIIMKQENIERLSSPPEVLTERVAKSPRSRYALPVSLDELLGDKNLEEYYFLGGRQVANQDDISESKEVLQIPVHRCPCLVESTSRTLPGSADAHCDKTSWALLHVSSFVFLLITWGILIPILLKTWADEIACPYHEACVPVDHYQEGVNGSNFASTNRLFTDFDEVSVLTLQNQSSTILSETAHEHIPCTANGTATCLVEAIFNNKTNETSTAPAWYLWSNLVDDQPWPINCSVSDNLTTPGPAAYRLFQDMDARGLPGEGGYGISMIWNKSIDATEYDTTEPTKAVIPFVVFSFLEQSQEGALAKTMLLSGLSFSSGAPPCLLDERIGLSHCSPEKIALNASQVEGYPRRLRKQEVCINVESSNAFLLDANSGARVVQEGSAHPFAWELYLTPNQWQFGRTVITVTADIFNVTAHGNNSAFNTSFCGSADANKTSAYMGTVARSFTLWVNKTACYGYIPILQPLLTVSTRSLPAVLFAISSIGELVLVLFLAPLLDRLCCRKLMLLLSIWASCGCLAALSYSCRSAASLASAIRLSCFAGAVMGFQSLALLSYLPLIAPGDKRLAEALGYDIQTRKEKRRMVKAKEREKKKREKREKKRQSREKAKAARKNDERGGASQKEPAESLTNDSHDEQGDAILRDRGPADCRGDPGKLTTVYVHRQDQLSFLGCYWGVQISLFLVGPAVASWIWWYADNESIVDFMQRFFESPSIENRPRKGKQSMHYPPPLFEVDYTNAYIWSITICCAIIFTASLPAICCLRCRRGPSPEASCLAWCRGCVSPLGFKCPCSCRHRACQICCGALWWGLPGVSQLIWSVARLLHLIHGLWALPQLRRLLFFHLISAEAQRSYMILLFTHFQRVSRIIPLHLIYGAACFVLGGWAGLGLCGKLQRKSGAGVVTSHALVTVLQVAMILPLIYSCLALVPSDGAEGIMRSRAEWFVLCVCVGMFAMPQVALQRSATADCIPVGLEGIAFGLVWSSSLVLAPVFPAILEYQLNFVAAAGGLGRNPGASWAITSLFFYPLFLHGISFFLWRHFHLKDARIEAGGYQSSLQAARDRELRLREALQERKLRERAIKENEWNMLAQSLNIEVGLLDTLGSNRRAMLYPVRFAFGGIQAMRQEVAAAHKKFLSWKKDECISGRVRLLLIYIEVIRRYKHLLWARPRWLRESKFFPAEKPDILMKALEHLEKEAEEHEKTKAEEDELRRIANEKRWTEDHIFGEASPESDGKTSRRESDSDVSSDLDSSSVSSSSASSSVSSEPET